jgi:hypothetical protein
LNGSRTELIILGAVRKLASSSLGRFVKRKILGGREKKKIELKNKKVPWLK